MLTDAFKRRPTAYRTVDLAERDGISGRLVHGDYDPETDTTTIGLATEDGNFRFAPDAALLEQIEAAFGTSDPGLGGVLSINNLQGSADGGRLWSAHWEPPAAVERPEPDPAASPADSAVTPSYQIPDVVFGEPDGAGVGPSQDVVLTNSAPRPRPRPQPVD